MALRKRKFIYSLGHHLLADERTKFCARFPSAIKKTAVCLDEAIEKLPTSLSFYTNVTVPAIEEGWTDVQFSSNAKKATEVLTKWQKKCKNMTKVDDFKASDKLKEKMTQWTKFRAATEKKA